MCDRNMWCTYKLSLFGFAKSHSAGKQSRKAGEHSFVHAQLRRCQGSRIGDYSFVLPDVVGTSRMDSLQIANRTFSTQFKISCICLLKDYCPSKQHIDPSTPHFNNKTGAYRGIHYFLTALNVDKLHVLVRT